jgi:hypothetical protein
MGLVPCCKYKSLIFQLITLLPPPPPKGGTQLEYDDPEYPVFSRSSKSNPPNSLLTIHNSPFTTHDSRLISRAETQRRSLKIKTLCSLLNTHNSFLAQRRRDATYRSSHNSPFTTHVSQLTSHVSLLRSPDHIEQPDRQIG